MTATDPTTRALSHDPERTAIERDAWVAFMAVALQSQKVVKVGEIMKADPPNAEEAAQIADSALAEHRKRWGG